MRRRRVPAVKSLILHHDGQTPFSATLSVVLMCCFLPPACLHPFTFDLKESNQLKFQGHECLFFYNCKNQDNVLIVMKCGTLLHLIIDHH